jgi:hypothetical protein
MIFKDTSDARDREIKIATAEAAPLLNKIVTPVLALSVITLTFVLFAVVMFDSTPIEPSRKDILVYVLGALTTIAVQVVSYYFGSSMGSKEKSDEIKRLMQ